MFLFYSYCFRRAEKRKVLFYVCLIHRDIFLKKNRKLEDKLLVKGNVK